MKNLIKTLKFIGVLATTVVVFTLIEAFVGDIYMVSGPSMEPALKNGDIVVTNSSDYAIASPPTYPLTDIEFPEWRMQTGTPERGEVVIYYIPGGMSQGGKFDQRHPAQRDVAVKRCVGLPGDEVRYTEDRVIINDDEYPIFRRMYQRQNNPEKMHLANTDFTSGLEYSKEDSTYTIKPSYYFLIGDNAHVSFDSRKHGPVHQNSLRSSIRFVLPI